LYALNYTLPFARNFLSFWAPLTLDDHHFRNTKNKKQILNLLKMQLLSVSGIEDFESVPKSYCLKNLLKLNRTWKIGKVFTLSPLFTDYFGLRDKINYNCVSFYSLDAVSSGIQIYSILTKDLELAKKVNLSESLEKESDLYSTCASVVKKQILNILTIFDEYKDLKGESKCILGNECEENDEYKPYIHLRCHLKEWVSMSNISFLNKTQNLDVNEKGTSVFVELFITFAELLAQARNLDLLKYINRKLFKQPLMTSVYSSTDIGRIDQFQDAFRRQLYSDGRLFTMIDFDIIKKLCLYLNRMLKVWLNSFHPNLLKLSNFISSTTLVEEYIFESPYFKVTFNPLETRKFRIYRGKKSYYIYVPISSKDIRKFKKGFCANFIQFMDAFIVHSFKSRVQKEYKFQTFTNHDCFYCSPINALRLKQTIRESYKEVMNFNILKTFKNEKLIECIKNNGGKDFTSDLLNGPDFVKH
jgi:hypothetical protein